MSELPKELRERVAELAKAYEAKENSTGYYERIAEDYEAGAQALWSELEPILRECEGALSEANAHYFDGSVEEYACATCDMGGAGRSKSRRDEHDDDCLIAKCHDALTKLKQLREQDSE